MSNITGPYFILVAVMTLLLLACDKKESPDPLAHPEGVVYCPGFDDPGAISPGHFSAVRDGEPIQGLSQVIERQNGLWRLDLYILHEACYLKFIGHMGHFPLVEGILLDSFEVKPFYCAEPDFQNPVDYNSIRTAGAGDVISDEILNLYYVDSTKNRSYMVLHEVNLERGYARGEFHLAMELDTSCVDFRQYPSTTVISEGEFTASLLYL